MQTVFAWNKYMMLCLFLLCALSVGGETVTHNFQTLTTNSEITYSNSNKVGKTDLLTYTCTSASKFESDDAVICLRLKGKNESATTTKVEGLTGITIGTPSFVNNKLEVYISRDSISWKKLTGDSINFKTATQTICSFPRGDYYVRYKESTAKDIDIYSFVYTMVHCNCFETR